MQKLYYSWKFKNLKIFHQISNIEKESVGPIHLTLYALLTLTSQ